MNELKLLLKNNPVALAAIAGVIFGVSAKTLATPKIEGVLVDPDNTVQKIYITQEQYTHISENSDGCVQYETELGMIALFAQEDAAVLPFIEDPTQP